MKNKLFSVNMFEIPAIVFSPSQNFKPIMTNRKPWMPHVTWNLEAKLYQWNEYLNGPVHFRQVQQNNNYINVYIATSFECKGAWLKIQPQVNAHLFLQCQLWLFLEFEWNTHCMLHIYMVPDTRPSWWTKLKSLWYVMVQIAVSNHSMATSFATSS